MMVEGRAGTKTWINAPYTATDLRLVRLAREAGLSPDHFLRIFESLTGATPHRYLLRTRLRAAAARLAMDSAKILDVALDAGFGDVSNFNRAFRAEFKVSPTVYRRRLRRPREPACVSRAVATSD